MFFCIKYGEVMCDFNYADYSFRWDYKENHGLFIYL